MHVMAEAAIQQLYSVLLVAFRMNPPDDQDERDRGAVSLEQVLWFVAVGVGVAVIAAILWTRIRDTAEETDNLNQPIAP